MKKWLMKLQSRRLIDNVSHVANEDRLLKWPVYYCVEQKENVKALIIFLHSNAQPTILMRNHFFTGRFMTQILSKK